MEITTTVKRYMVDFWMQDHERLSRFVFACECTTTSRRLRSKTLERPVWIDIYRLVPAHYYKSPAGPFVGCVVELALGSRTRTLDRLRHASIR